MVTEHRAHEVGELCEAGGALYARALRDGRVHSSETSRAPCLRESGLLVPDDEDARWFRPVAPAVALPQLLDGIEKRIAQYRRREAALAASFQPLMGLHHGKFQGSATPGVTVLHGHPAINSTIGEILADSRHEVLTVQPGGRRPNVDQADAIRRTQEFIERGGRTRTLYQHTARYSPWATSYYEQLTGDVEVRTLDELPNRLLVFDRKVALIPADRDHGNALALRTPAVISYLVTVFDLMWRLATPMFPEAAYQPTKNGITPRQQAIAALLTEGLTDTEIAARLGMNVRTARVHIAKLSAVLKSTSRAQLGYLIGKSGILDHTH
ncbi:response regulator transcription factor [Streptomyces aureoverticillatus]|nr:response regulator transcription factor [Streptomyces aureoverticillatus]